MTTHRRYSFLHPHPVHEGHDQVRTVLERACELHWWYQDPEVSGQPFGRLAFSVTVSARDQWWAHRRALVLATDCYHVLGLGEEGIPEPDWEPLAPHTNRGHQRVPAAPASGSFG